jgi:hypothetical protein
MRASAEDSLGSMSDQTDKLASRADKHIGTNTRRMASWAGTQSARRRRRRRLQKWMLPVRRQEQARPRRCLRARSLRPPWRGGARVEVLRRARPRREGRVGPCARGVWVSPLASVVWLAAGGRATTPPSQRSTIRRPVAEIVPTVRSAAPRTLNARGRLASRQQAYLPPSPPSNPPPHHLDAGANAQVLFERAGGTEACR